MAEPLLSPRGAARHRESRSASDRQPYQPRPSARSRHALDWFVFFVADVQTGFGPFVAVYLTAEKWTQGDIGLILTAGGLAGLLLQIPAGALIDSVRSIKLLGSIAVLLVGAAAFAIAAWPVLPVVLLSRILHAGASCVLGLAIASISLSLTGRRGVSRRLGRNASFASIGTGLAAAGMGACGYFLSNRAVFVVTGLLVLPAMVALMRIRTAEIKWMRTEREAREPPGLAAIVAGVRAVVGNPPLLIFAGCTVLFHLANAGMLPLAASILTLRSTQAAAVMVAAAVVVPQIIVAALSPLVGNRAQRWGRKPLLMIGFSTLVLRGILFAFTVDPKILVVVQVLDGISAAVLGVLVPLTIADVTRRSGHFNLSQGTVGCAVGVGASISTVIAGHLDDRFGNFVAFSALAGVAAVGLLAVALLMPETREEPPRPPSRPPPAGPRPNPPQAAKPTAVTPRPARSAATSPSAARPPRDHPGSMSDTLQTRR